MNQLGSSKDDSRRRGDDFGFSYKPRQSSGQYGRDGHYGGRDVGYGGRDSGYGGRDGGFWNRDGGYGGRTSGYGGRSGEYGGRENSFPAREIDGFGGRYDRTVERYQSGDRRPRSFDDRWYPDSRSRYRSPSDGYRFASPERFDPSRRQRFPSGQQYGFPGGDYDRFRYGRQYSGDRYGKESGSDRYGRYRIPSGFVEFDRHRFRDDRYSGRDFRLGDFVDRFGRGPGRYSQGQGRFSYPERYSYSGPLYTREQFRFPSGRSGLEFGRYDPRESRIPQGRYAYDDRRGIDDERFRQQGIPKSGGSGQGDLGRRGPEQFSRERHRRASLQEIPNINRRFEPPRLERLPTRSYRGSEEDKGGYEMQGGSRYQGGGVYGTPSRRDRMPAPIPPFSQPRQSYPTTLVRNETLCVFW